jgi:HB1, ASXL, restriction endonuclease HTH domain
MDIRDAIQQRIKQVKRLEEEIAALQRAEKLVEESSPASSKPGTQADMATSVLELAGKPMHVSDISTQIRRKFGIQIKTNNLGVMLFRYAKRGSKFYKAKGKPNTYGLVKWEETSIPERLEVARGIQ